MRTTIASRQSDCLGSCFNIFMTSLSLTQKLFYALQNEINNIIITCADGVRVLEAIWVSFGTLVLPLPKGNLFEPYIVVLSLTSLLQVHIQLNSAQPKIYDYMKIVLHYQIHPEFVIEESVVSFSYWFWVAVLMIIGF